MQRVVVVKTPGRVIRKEIPIRVEMPVQALSVVVIMMIRVLAEQEALIIRLILV